MIDLSAFLLARFAEDEAAARAAQPEVWYSYFRNVMVLGDDKDFVCDVATKGDARHIARHDPARVLAECEAKRRIVERHLACDDTGLGDDPCDDLRVLAAIYGAHPDYRAGWAP